MDEFESYAFYFKSRTFGKYVIFARSNEIANDIIADVNALLNNYSKFKRYGFKSKVVLCVPPYELEEEQRQHLLKLARGEAKQGGVDTL